MYMRNRKQSTILSHAGGQVRRSRLLLVCAGLLTATVAQCQLVDQYDPPRGNCCLAGSAKSLADQLQDWDQIGRYHAANVELRKQAADPKRVVFMGDSINELWRLTRSEGRRVGPER